MARPLRVNRPAVWYHITGRGTERRTIFTDNRDRRHFVELLSACPKRFGLRLHAYVLMDNHYHLLIETPLANLSQAMQWLNVSYSVWFNRRHERVGPLFQGRFKAVVVEPFSWGLFVSRYVHLNPVRIASLGLDKAAQSRQRRGINDAPNSEQVRARLNRLTRYPWSSYLAYAALAPCPEWLTRSSVLELIGQGNGQERSRAYRKYAEEAIREGLLESPWEKLAGRLILGSQTFITRVRQSLRGNIKEQPALRALQPRPEWPQILRALEAIKGEPWRAFRDRHRDWGRDMALYLGRTQCGLTLRQLGELVGGLDYRTISWTVARFTQLIAHDKQIRKSLHHVQKHIQNPET